MSAKHTRFSSSDSSDSSDEDDVNLVDWPFIYDPFGDVPMDENMLDPDEIRTATGSSSRGEYSDEEWEDMYNNLVAIFTNMQNTLPQLVNPTIDVVSNIIRSQWSRIYDVIVAAVRINRMVDSRVADVLKELNTRFRDLFLSVSPPMVDPPSAFGDPGPTEAQYVGIKDSFGRITERDEVFDFYELLKRQGYDQEELFALREWRLRDIENGTSTPYNWQYRQKRRNAKPGLLGVLNMRPALSLVNKNKIRRRVRERNRPPMDFLTPEEEAKFEQEKREAFKDVLPPMGAASSSSSSSAAAQRPRRSPTSIGEIRRRARLRAIEKRLGKKRKKTNLVNLRF